MKKSVLSRAIVALLFVIATVFAGVTPASATATTLAWDGSAPTFSAGVNSPVMGFVVTPGDSNPYNRIKLEVFNSAGTAVETSGSIHMAMSGHNLSECFTVLNSPLLGCTKDSDDAGFFEYSNGTTGQVHLQFNAGLFTMPSAAGNYTFRVGLYNGGSEISSATLSFTQSVVHYNITFSAGGGSGTQASITTNGPTFTLPANTFTPPSGKVFVGWNDPAVSNAILNAGSSYTANSSPSLIKLKVAPTRLLAPSTASATCSR